MSDYIKERTKVRNENFKEYKRILELYGYSCAICEWSIPDITPNGKIQKQNGCELHHIIPYRDGGTNDANNLILLCPNCHKKADNGLIEDIRTYQRIESRVNKLDYIKKQHKLLGKQ